MNRNISGYRDRSKFLDREREARGGGGRREDRDDRCETCIRGDSRYKIKRQRYMI